MVANRSIRKQFKIGVSYKIDHLLLNCVKITYPTVLGEDSKKERIQRAEYFEFDLFAKLPRKDVAYMIGLCQNIKKDQG